MHLPKTLLFMSLKNAFLKLTFGLCPLLWASRVVDVSHAVSEQSLPVIHLVCSGNSPLENLGGTKLAENRGANRRG